jgi:hypothetical protein
MSEQEPRITVRKISCIMPVSIHALIDAGAITEEQARERGWTPPPRPSRRTLLRWRLETWWYEHKPHAHLGPCNHEDCG